MSPLRRGIALYWRRLITPNVPGPTGSVQGVGFISEPVVIGSIPNTGVVYGDGFFSAASVYSGGIATGSSFLSGAAIVGLAENTGYVYGEGFTSTVAIVGAHDFTASVTGRGFKSVASIYGGGFVTGYSFKSSAAIAGTGPVSGSVTGARFNSNVTILGSASISGHVLGRGFISGLVFSRVTGRGFSSNITVRSTFDTAYAEAFVMNLANNPVSRYTNFPFMHLARISSTYYGFTPTGMYALTGDYDSTETTPVVGSITTNTEDFNTFQSKNVPFIYVDTDSEVDVTSIVDGVEVNTYTATFSGRKVKLGRGAKGRYWAFKIDNITKLQGLEYLPDTIQRRVK